MNILTIRNDMGLKEIGLALARSGFFTDSRDAEQAIVKVLAGAELGIGPVASMTGIYIVKGRVTLSANLIAGAIKRSGKYNFKVAEHDDTHCVIVFYEGGETIGTSAFSMTDAKRAGLAGDNWQKYPRNMTYARAMSNGAKWYCPDVFAGGVYTPDELGEVVDGNTGEVTARALEVGKGNMPPIDLEQPAPKSSPAQTVVESHALSTAAVSAPQDETNFTNFSAAQAYVLEHGITADEFKAQIKSLGLKTFKAARDSVMVYDYVAAIIAARNTEKVE